MSITVISSSSRTIDDVEGAILLQQNASRINDSVLQDARNSLLGDFLRNTTSNTSTVDNGLNSVLSTIRSSLLQQNNVVNNALSGISTIIRQQGFQSQATLANALSAVTRATQRSTNELNQNTAFIRRYLQEDSGIQRDLLEKIDRQQDTFERLVNSISNRDTQSIEKRIEDSKAWFEAMTKGGDVEPLNLFNGDVELPFYLEPFRNIFEMMYAVGLVINYVGDRSLDIIDIFNRLENGEIDSIDNLYRNLGGSQQASAIIEGIANIVNFLPFFLDIIRSQAYKGQVELDILKTRDGLPQRLNADILTNALRRLEIDENEFLDLMKDIGWSEERSNQYKRFTTFYPSTNEFLEMYRRGFYNDDSIEGALKWLGLDDAFILRYKELAWYVPPVQDIIRMAIRDVFSPDIVEQGGLNNELPTEFIRRAKQSGLKEDVAKLYWAAHWVIPSIQQGYEMFQRSVITRQELETLFKAADIAPNWRDKLLQISYNIPTRVDTRRMYEDGVIDDETLKKYLKDYGYNPTDLENVFGWYQRRREQVRNSGNPEYKQLSLSMIVRAYKEGILSRSEAVSKLTRLGYLLEDVGTILDLAVSDNQSNINELLRQNLVNRTFKTIEHAYLHKAMDNDVAISELRALGLNDNTISSYIILWDKELELDRKESLQSELQKLYVGYEIDSAELNDYMMANGFSIQETRAYIESLEPFRNLRTKDLSRTDLKKAILSGVITLAQYKEQLKGLGYSDSDIDIIVAIEGVNTQ